jgi:hypothetical protein
MSPYKLKVNARVVCMNSFKTRIHEIYELVQNISLTPSFPTDATAGAATAAGEAAAAA